MACHSLSIFKFATVFKKVSNPCSSERVAADRGLDSSIFGPAANHSPCTGSIKAVRGESARAAACAPKKWSSLMVANFGCLNVLIEDVTGRFKQGHLWALQTRPLG